MRLRKRQRPTIAGWTIPTHTDEITVVLGEGYEDQLDVSWLTWRDR